ncbi:hypothetical protein C8J46_102627, partial [Sphingomonas sp. PP-F2F-A104-K0414]
MMSDRAMMVKAGEILAEHGDVTPAFHPAATRDRPLLSRRSAGEATVGFKP